MNRVNLTLNIDSIALPAQQAAVRSSEIVDFMFGAISRGDLSKQADNQGTFYKFQSKEISADARREAYEEWILSKAFQDLMRGLKGSAELGYFFLELLSSPIKAKTETTVDELLAPFRKKANGLNFPQLLEEINRHLPRPLHFSDSYISLQKARNCLEHRHGIVGKADLNAAKSLEIRIPYLKTFFVRDGEEIPLLPGTYIEAQTTIFARMDTRTILFQEGERLRISMTDFNEIAFGCNQFAASLASAVLAHANRVRRVSFINSSGSVHEVHSVPIGTDPYRYAENYNAKQIQRGEEYRETLIS